MSASRTVLVVAILISGCDSSTELQPAELSTQELPCSSSIESEVTLPPSYTNILGVVALPTSDSADHALQVSRDDSAPDGQQYWAKTGLLVMSGRSFELAVAEELIGSALIGWGGPASFTEKIVSSGCDVGSGWIAFPGGFVVDQPRCVRLVASDGETEQTVEVGVGAPCEGQAPPPEPTDS